MENAELEYIEYIKEAPMRMFVVSLLTSSMHWHEEYEIVFVLRGSVLVTVESESYELLAGELLLINPKIVHSFTKTQTDNTCLILQFSTTLIADDYKHSFTFDLSPRDEILPEIISRLSHLLAHMGILLHKKPDGYQFEVRGLLYIFISLMFRHLQYKPIEDTLAPKTFLEDFDLIKEYIKNHCLEEIRQEHIGQALGMSRSKVYRIFHKAGKLSTHELVNYYRIEEAKHLLKNTKFSISNIAQKSGFASESTFYRSFKVQTGFSPADYRKNPTKQTVSRGVQGYALPNSVEYIKLLYEYIKSN